jgi:NADH dehydrogenase FAD-containing subunit
MTATIFRSFDRLETYTARARRSVELEDYALALAEVAEAAEIARRLWDELQKANQEKEASHD